MHSQATLNAFIELRSEGKSYRDISNSLKISIGLASTLEWQTCARAAGKAAV